MVNGISTQQQTQGIMGFHHHKRMEDMFSDLSKSVGGDGTSISKDELQKAIQDAQSQGDTKKATMLSKMLDNFDQLSGGNDTITADSLKNAMKTMRKGFSKATQDTTTKGNCIPCINCGSCGKTQDIKSITSDQLKSSIDIKV